MPFPARSKDLASFATKVHYFRLFQSSTSYCLQNSHNVNKTVQNKMNIILQFPSHRHPLFLIHYIIFWGCRIMTCTTSFKFSVLSWHELNILTTLQERKQEQFISYLDERCWSKIMLFSKCGPIWCCSYTEQVMNVDSAYSSSAVCTCVYAISIISLVSITWR